MYISRAGVSPVLSAHIAVLTIHLNPLSGAPSCQLQSQWDAMDCDKLQQLTVER